MRDDALIETCHDIANTELLLSVLEQRDEGALASVRELAGGDAHVERVLPEHRVPVGPDPAQTRSGEWDLKQRWYETMRPWGGHDDPPSLQCPDRCPEPLGPPVAQYRLWCDWIPVHHSQGQRDILVSPHRCPLGIPNLHGWHQTRCRGPASSEMQAGLVASASIESLINIESLFSLLSISLIFRLDFSLTIDLTWN